MTFASRAKARAAALAVRPLRHSPLQLPACRLLSAAFASASAIRSPGAARRPRERRLFRREPPAAPIISIFSAPRAGSGGQAWPVDLGGDDLDDLLLPGVFVQASMRATSRSRSAQVMRAAMVFFLLLLDHGLLLGDDDGALRSTSTAASATLTCLSISERDTARSRHARGLPRPPAWLLPRGVAFPSWPVNWRSCTARFISSVRRFDGLLGLEALGLHVEAADFDDFGRFRFLVGLHLEDGTLLAWRYPPRRGAAARASRWRRRRFPFPHAPGHAGKIHWRARARAG